METHFIDSRGQCFRSQCCLCFFLMLLRSYIQFLPNVYFIFAGSKQQMMTDMFLSAKRPFLSEFADGVAAAYRQAGISGFCKSVDGEGGVVCR